MRIQKIQCGKEHCMALLNVGALVVWGGNEKGQLGNKKRSFSENPLIVSRFKDREVIDIFANDYQNLVKIKK